MKKKLAIYQVVVVRGDQMESWAVRKFRSKRKEGKEEEEKWKVRKSSKRRKVLMFLMLVRIGRLLGPVQHTEDCMRERKRRRRGASLKQREVVHSRSRKPKRRKG